MNDKNHDVSTKFKAQLSASLDIQDALNLPNLKADSESDYSYSIYKHESQIDEASGPSDLKKDDESHFSECDVDEGDLQKNFMCVSNSEFLASQAHDNRFKQAKVDNSSSLIGFSQIIRT